MKRREEGSSKNVDPLGAWEFFVCFVLLACAEGRASWDYLVAFEGTPSVTVVNLLCATQQPTWIKE